MFDPRRKNMLTFVYLFLVITQLPYNMASFVYTMVSMVEVSCSMRPEISPCSCKPHRELNNTINVDCEGLASFNQVVDTLQNKFSNTDQIILKITKSQLDDLETRTFEDMKINIIHLQLNYDELRTVPESSFRNLHNLKYISLADNKLEEIPRHILLHMPDVGTIDLAQGNIQKIKKDDFRDLKKVRYLVLVNNKLKSLEKDSIPKTISILHLGQNSLTSLNGTLREIENMTVLFLNHNNLTILDDELPIKSKDFKSLQVHHNKLQRLPQDLKKFPLLDAVICSDNELRSLDGVFKNATFIQGLNAANNKIEYLAQDEFLEAGIHELDLSKNNIKSINGSLLTLKHMRNCNFSRNLLSEFSLNEIRGLRALQLIDLSYNRIEKLTGRMENIVEPDLFVFDLLLDHNLLKSLDGAMMGMNHLKKLSLSYNLLKWISPDDLIGLEELQQLDVSHNNLQTLEETSKTFLPKLEILNASYNNLTKLERDFHGLPVLCSADLSNNWITSISPEVVAKTRCSNHGVIEKLEIILQENPILCMDEVSKLFGLMEAQETRLSGIAHCIVPKEVIPNAPSVYVVPPLTLPLIPTLAMINSPMPVLPKALYDSPSGIVQVLLPIAAEKVEEMVAITTTPTPTAKPVSFSSSTTPTYSPETIAASTEMIKPISVPQIILKISIDELSTVVNKTDIPVSTSNPDDNNIDIINDTTHIATSSLPFNITINSVTETVTETLTVTESDKDTVAQTETDTETTTIISTTNSTVPTLSVLSTTLSTTTLPSTVTTTSSVAEIVLGKLETISAAPEPDNYVYETYSPVPQVIGPMVERAQQLVIVEEPPEILPNDPAPAA